MGANGENIEIPGAVKTVFAKLEEEFGERLLDSSLFRGELTFVIAPGDYLDILTFCKESEDLQFDRLDCLMGNHFPEREDKPFQVLVHLVSQPNNTRLRLKVLLAEGEKLPTLSGLWRSADWDERETWEMYGIEFDGHPDLRRLLTVSDLEGFPLRKDFPLEGTVGGRVRTNLKGKI